MDLGIFAKTFRRTNARSTLEAVQTLGLGCVQFNFECCGLPSMPERISSSALEAIAAATRQTGVRLAALSGTFNMVHPDPLIRHQGIQRLQVLIEAAAQLGIPLVTLCTGTRDQENMWRGHPDNQSEQAWSDLLETMEKVLPVAVNAGIALAIEPEHANVVADASRARTLLDTLKAGEWLKIIIDPANLLETTRPPYDVLQQAFDLLGPELAIAHAKDRQSDGQNCVLGKGVVDFGSFFSLLLSSGFRGPIIMHGFEEADAVESTAFARAKLSELK
jgi:sugar phosphate isomerase/epimerase